MHAALQRASGESFFLTNKYTFGFRKMPETLQKVTDYQQHANAKLRVIFKAVVW